jgi:hypothetical protein
MVISYSLSDDLPAWAARNEALHQQASTLSEEALGRLLGALVAALLKDAPPATAPLRHLVKEVQDHLHGTRQQKLSLAALAQRFSLDKYKLICLFSRFTGAMPN